MAIHRVIGKLIFRASVVPTQMGTAPDGAPIIVQQPGPMQRLDVGTLLTDVQPDELAAFGDRLEEVSQEQADAEALAQEMQDEAARKAAVEATVQAARVAADVAQHAAVTAQATAKEAMRMADLKEAEAKAAASGRAARHTPRVTTEEIPAEQPAPPAGRHSATARPHAAPDKAETA